MVVWLLLFLCFVTSINCWNSESMYKEWKSHLSLYIIEVWTKPLPRLMRLWVIYCYIHFSVYNVRYLFAMLAKDCDCQFFSFIYSYLICHVKPLFPFDTAYRSIIKTIQHTISSLNLTTQHHIDDMLACSYYQKRRLSTRKAANNCR